MKLHKIIILTAVIASVYTLTSCDDFLDLEPESQIAPETYFLDQTQLQAYVDNLYSIVPSHTGGEYGMFGGDKNTDNQIGTSADNKYTPNLWQVPSSDAGWSFGNIYNINFFFSNVLPKFGDASGSDFSGSGNTIHGDLNIIKHLIGEMYFLRASEYFYFLKKFGDFPIITEPLPDNMDVLTEASRRFPHNEVARFILSDLDKAVELLTAKEMGTDRINRDIALLLKSRVALYEGTWLKYFKGTPFVPNGEGWPGKQKDYNANYTYPLGGIDEEINYFLDLAIESSREVAEKYKNSLTENTGILKQSDSDPENPYYNMYCSTDLTTYKEVLMWRQYAQGLSTHNVTCAANWGNYLTGLTSAYVNNFLMADGTPVYAHGTYADGDGYYMGDKTITDVRTNRDSRLSLFLKDKGQVNIIYQDMPGIDVQITEGAPNILSTSDVQRGYSTGYALRKGAPFKQSLCVLQNGYTGAICYRAAEALLNYMEAYYERHSKLDANATEYWKLIRKRALVSDDINKTINATDMDKEAENDWGAYSAGMLLTDKVLYNIRRERRCEFLSEGFRNDDLRRWRAMDQLITTPFVPKGFHFWNTPIQNWYEADKVISDGSSKSNMSPESYSEYYCPFHRQSNQNCYDGLTWKMAHYLHPLDNREFQITSPDGKTVENSVLYQNPYWPVEASLPAIK